jgi:hypothetical protein
MLEFACEKKGLLKEMDTYRVRVECSLMHTLLLFRHTMRGA